MITTVGSWVTRSALQDPPGFVAAMKRARVGWVSIMCNDFSGDRGPSEFWTHDPAKIVALADACHDAGIEVTLTSWAMPHRSFIEAATGQLLPLIAACRATLLVWDAEEPWVRATNAMRKDDAAALIGELFDGVPMGMTGIVYASEPDLRGLATVCPTWLPQAYAIEGGELQPNKAVDRALEQWRAKFGEPDRWIMGLAAWNQPPDPEIYMQPCIDAAFAAGLDSVAYWSHKSIETNVAVAEFIAGISDVPAPDTGGIMPVLNIADLPSGTRVQTVAEAQGLLVAWGEDPGAIDGKPGDNTLAAVQAFQSAHGLAATGVVDGATWWALLRA